MARTQTRFVCGECGAETPRWAGQCPQCKAWDSLQPAAARPRGRAAVGAPTSAVGITQRSESASERLKTGSGEFDRVLGGGLVGGAVILIGGEPGIGKSTLLLQVAAAVAGTGRVLYASGEESVPQISLRASRLGCAEAPMSLLSDSSLDDVLAVAADSKPALLVIDSIQTMRLEGAAGSPGSPVQLRECTAALVNFAKQSGCPTLIVGHVTKEGSLAGPKMLEHLVDTVLYFESDTAGRFRMLRAAKNRFGTVNEQGFFAMLESGLKDVPNPSALFLSRRSTPVAGSVVMVARDGSRPLLLEVQALVDRCYGPVPRRVVQGLDGTRLSMLLAILGRHGGIALHEHDVFVNLVGGIHIDETATDLPVLMAVVSSLRGTALPGDMVVFGELGLTGEVRAVAHGVDRLRDLTRHGFGRALLPRENMPRVPLPGLDLKPVATLEEALRLF